MPFLTLTLWSPTQSSDALRPLAAELAEELSEIEDTSKASLIGGQPRAVRVEPDPDRMAAAGITWTQLTGALQSAAALQDAGTAVRDNREVRVEAGPLFRSAEDVGRVVVAVRAGRPVYVRQRGPRHRRPRRDAPTPSSTRWARRAPRRRRPRESSTRR